MRERVPSFYKVQLPSDVGPTIHVCRYPVPQGRSFPEFAMVPFPKPEPWDRGALAVEALLLPEGYQGGRLQIVPRDVDPLTPLWHEDSDSPLLVPESVVRDRRVAREWRVRSLVTPTSVGVGSHAPLSTVAWAVLCRADRNNLAAALARLACVVDRFRWDPSRLEAWVELMNPPPAVRGPLLAAARGGETLFHPRAIQWVLREILVVDEDERAVRAEWTPEGTDDACLLGGAWFDCLVFDRPPSIGEVLLAVWILHEDFHGGTNDGGDADSLMSLATALGYRFGNGGSWLSTLARWRDIWAVPDAHPVVTSAAMTPTQVRLLYATSLGTTVDRWLSGTWALCVKWWLELTGDLPVVTDAQGVFTFPLDSGPIELSADFRAAFRQHAIGSLRQFATAARSEASEYTGLGSLPQTDSLACRNSPVLEMPDGALLPISVDLVAERAAGLHRFMLGAQGTAPSAVGSMFEAYAHDLIARLGGRHLVVTEKQLADQLGPMASRCDGLIIDGDTCLAVEVAIQTMSRRVATGELGAIRNMAERYQHEADQAFATIRELPALSRTLGIPRPHHAVALVVTDLLLPHSPVFLNTLSALRPGRTAKVVCSMADFELLVDLSVMGWSAPAAVASWQAKVDVSPLDQHLHEMSRTLRASIPDAVSSTDSWLALLRQTDASAA